MTWGRDGHFGWLVRSLSEEAAGLWRSEGRAGARTPRQVEPGFGRDRKTGTVAGAKWTREARSAERRGPARWGP